MTDPDELQEDLEDIKCILERANEPTRPYEEFLAELEAEIAASPAVPWECQRCGHQVNPGAPVGDTGFVCPQCHRVICRQCAGPGSPRDRLCRDCAQQETPPH